MQAALDVFNQEPPPANGPLHNRPDVVCTPHLGASTKEAQEGVAVEIADAVIGALKVSTALQPPFAALSWAPCSPKCHGCTCGLSSQSLTFVLVFVLVNVWDSSLWGSKHMLA